MPEKLLAINFGGIGDEILFLPALKAIRNAFPKWHITLLLEPRSKSIKEITNLIDDIKVFDIKKRPLLPGDYLCLGNILRSGNYQTVISSGSSPLVACLLFLSGIKQRIGYDSGLLSRFLLTKAIKLNKNQYAGNMLHDLVQGLELAREEVEPEIQVPNASIETIQNFLNSCPDVSGKAKILIHPGISKMAVKKGIQKNWSSQKWAFLINKLLENQNIEVFLVGGPDDQYTISEIQQLLQEKYHNIMPSNFRSVYGLTKSLADLAALIKLTDLLICVDSAPMHVAVAQDKSLLAIFGPTDPAYLLPQRPHFKFVKMKASNTNDDVDAISQIALNSLQSLINR